MRQNDGLSLFFPVQELPGNCVLDSDFSTLEFSVIYSQPKELQQLLAVFVDEVCWLLSTVVLQLGVGTKGQKVAGADRPKATVLPKQTESLRLAGQVGLCSVLVSVGVNGARMRQILPLLLACVLALASARVCW